MSSLFQENVDPMTLRIGSDANGKSDTSIDLQPLFRRAIEESLIQHKVVAAAMGVPPSHLSEMLAGKRPLTMNRFELVPFVVQRIFARLYAQATRWIVTQEDPLVQALVEQQLASAKVVLLLSQRGLPTMSAGQLKIALDAPAQKVTA